MAPLDHLGHGVGAAGLHHGLPHGLPHDAHHDDVQAVRRVTLLLSPNGSLLLVPEDAADAGSLSGLGALLVATFAAGLALNVLLLLALLSSEGKARARAAQVLLVAANALDCLLNVPAAATVVTSWPALVDRSPDSARTLCRLSAASGQATAILQTLAVLVLVLDRCLSLAEAPGSSTTFSLTSSRAGAGRKGRCASAATWGLLWGAAPLALAVTAPIAATANVRMFPTRYACGMVRLAGDTPWPGVAVLVVGYLAWWALLVIGVSMAARRAALQRWRRRQLELAAQQQGRGVAAAASSPGLTFSLVDTPLGHLSLDEYRALTHATVLVAMYVAMLVPGILSTQVLQLMTSKPRAAHGPADLWPVLTGTYETVLVWLRLQFSIVVPVAIAILSKDVRRRVGEMTQCLYQACCCCLCCCSRRANAVGQALPLPQRRYGQLGAAATPHAAPSLGLGLGRGQRWARLRHRNADASSRSDGAETIVSPGTAVLFASAQGLHLRTLDPRWARGEEDADAVSTLEPAAGRRVRGGAADGPPQGVPPPASAPWGEDSLPRYVFQFCDLAVIEEVPRHSPEASTALAGRGFVLGHGSAPARKAVQDADEREPSLTREELQASLGKPRSLSNSYRKNVRFASVVSEIPIPTPLSMVAEADGENDPTTSSSTASSSATASTSASSSATDSPIRYAVARPRTRSLELALVSEELQPPPRDARVPAPLNYRTGLDLAKPPSARTSKV